MAGSDGPWVLELGPVRSQGQVGQIRIDWLVEVPSHCSIESSAEQPSIAGRVGLGEGFPTFAPSLIVTGPGVGVSAWFVSNLTVWVRGERG